METSEINFLDVTTFPNLTDLIETDIFYNDTNSHDYLNKSYLVTVTTQAI